LVRSRSGRWIAKWETIRRLKDFRVKTIPVEHPLYSDERVTAYDQQSNELTVNQLKDASGYFKRSGEGETTHDVSD
jgi:hypothetical protein